ncbi:MAG TPA: hypothetical protein VJA21_00935 [Verrucomicrobiae bacterium]
MKTASPAILVATAIFLGALPLPLPAQNVQLLTTSDPALVPSGGSGDSWTPVVSADGRFVLFCSTAHNLILASNNLPIPVAFPPNLNVFLRDRTRGTTTLVSVNSSGVAGGNGSSMPVDISTNGQYVLFESTASDLVAGDTNNVRDVFVRDTVNGSTVLVSVATNGLAGNGASSSPVMTPDGLYVAFVSAASNLVPDDTNGVADVFVRDLENHTTVLASPGAVSRPWDLGAESPEISEDGHYVVFFSLATNLAPGLMGRGDVFVRDLVGNTTVWASSFGHMGAASSNVICFNHSLSANGRYVVYEAADMATNCGTILRYDIQSGQTLTVDTNAAVSHSLERITTLDISPDGRFIAYIANAYDTSGTNTCIRLWDAQSSQSTLVSGDLAGFVPTNSICDWPTVDPTGRYAGFLSTAPGLVTNALGGPYHLYLRDLQTAATLLLDIDTNAVGTGVSAGTIPRLSADARVVALECNDGNLVAGDNNHAWDVFLRDLATGNIEMISAREATLPSATPNGPSTITPYSISSDGRFFAFSSTADNLVLNDTNGWRDAFVRDAYNGVTTLVSVATNGASADNFSSEPAISADGRYVVFTSSADNLTTGLGTRKQQIFLRDLKSGTTTLASVNPNGTAGSGDCFGPQVSPGGRFVLFWSKALDLTGTPTFGRSGIYLRDLQLSKTYLLITAPFGASVSPAFAATPDWHFVAVSGGTSASIDTPVVRVWDTSAAMFAFQTAASQQYACEALAITPDARRLAFGGYSRLYVCDLTNGTPQLILLQASNLKTIQLSQDGHFLMLVGRYSGLLHVFLSDLDNPGTPMRVDHAFGSPGAISDCTSDSASLSPDGRFVVYRSLATNLVPGDTNGVADIFLYDRLTGTNMLLSATASGGVPNLVSAMPIVAADGRTIFFESAASDLVPNGFSFDRDIFAYPFLYATILPGSSPGEGPWVSWPFVPGRNYRVQYQDALNDAQWQDLGGSVTNLGTRAYMQDPAPDNSHRLYRILSY